MSQKSLDREGWAVIPGVFLPHEMEALSDELSPSALPRSRAGVRHALRNPAVAKLARDARLVRIAQAVMGAAAFPFRATLFDKSPQANWLVAWHQDTAVPLRERQEIAGWGPWSIKEGVTYAHAPADILCRILTIRVHLDHSTMRNGPLRVLSGSHNAGVLSDEEIHQLAGSTAPTECPVPRGGLLLMRPLLVHSSSKSQVAASRRVLHIECITTTAVGGGLELAVN